MLIRHVAYYLLARGVPGLVNFAALAVYTRLLAPDEFGRYALVLAGVGLANVVVFQWLRLVLLRFLHAQGDDPQPFLAGIFALFLTLALAVTGVGSLLALWWPDPIWQSLLALAVPLLLTQAWFELNLDLLCARLAPLAYGKLLGSKAVIALSIGALLAWIGLGAFAPLLGLIAGHALAFSLFGLAAWKGVRPAWPAASQLREQLRYGLPLTITFALAWVVSGSDRLLLAWLLDEDAAGYYSAGYDLAFQSLTLVVTIINTAAFPLAVNALERGGPVQAREQLTHNGELIITTALSGAAGLVILAPAVLGLFIGEAFRPGAAAILPIMAAASAMAAIKAYHFDIAFHLGKHAQTLAWISAMAAVANIGFNLLLIPRLGIVGAAWATLIAYAIALFASAGIGRRAFCMPSVFPMLGKSCAAAMFAALGLSLPSILNGKGPWVLPAAFLGGALSILGVACLFNLVGARRTLKGLMRKGLRTKKF